MYQSATTSPQTGFQAVSNRITPTAYIKLIDVWLIFGLVLPFVVFFLLVLIDHLPSSPGQEGRSCGLYTFRKGLVVFARFVMPTIIAAFVFLYSIVAAVIYAS